MRTPVLVKATHLEGLTGVWNQTGWIGSQDAIPPSATMYGDVLVRVEPTLRPGVAPAYQRSTLSPFDRLLIALTSRS